MMVLDMTIYCSPHLQDDASIQQCKEINKLQCILQSMSNNKILTCLIIFVRAMSVWLFCILHEQAFIIRHLQSVVINKQIYHCCISGFDHYVFCIGSIGMNSQQNEIFIKRAENELTHVEYIDNTFLLLLCSTSG